MAEFIFLSHSLSSATPGYGGNIGFTAKKVSCIASGGSSNSQSWTLSNHIGTHIDAPRHFSEDGKTLTDYDADFWVFRKTYLVDRPAKPGKILSHEYWCDEIPDDTELLLLRTGFESLRGQPLYWQENPGIAPDLGTWLRANRPSIRMLGFDFLSVTSYTNRPLGREAHKALLAPDTLGSNPILVIEDMALAKLEVTPELVVVSPLRVDQTDGAPATVIAFLPRG